MKIKGIERYQRQILLDGFGMTGQQKLFEAKVLVIGAGGLGCPVLQYLAAAGIGTLGVVDHDVVELSNLHRQVLYDVNDVGLLKADCVAKKLSQFNPDINVIPFSFQLTTQNAASILCQFDLVIDGSDNFPTRYMLNDACVLLGLPLVYAALSASEGQVAIFNVGDEEGKKVNYRDIFPDPPRPGEVLNCSEAGVLGVLPGIIGTMQAAEAIKLISGVGNPLVNQMLIYDLYTNQCYKIQLSAADQHEKNNIPADLEAFRMADYNVFCGIAENTLEVPEIDENEFREIMFDTDYEIVDVREEGEIPVAPFDHVRFPLSEIRRKVPVFEKDKLVLFCHSGIRSVTAVQLLLSAYPEKEIYSLKGGLLRLI